MIAPLVLMAYRSSEYKKNATHGVAEGAFSIENGRFAKGIP